VLFDLRSGKRRRVVQIVYGGLAASFLIGFVFFGVGSGGIGSISDIFSSGGGGSTSSAFEAQISHAEDVLKKDPQNEQALSNLANYQFQSGRTGVTQSDPTQAPTVSQDAQTAFSNAVDAWSRYLKVANKPDPALANEMAQAYVFLNDANGAARAQRIFAEAQPSTASFGNLAIYLYLAGDFKSGDAAAKQAVTKAPQGQAKQTQAQLGQVKQRAEKLAKAQKAATRASSGGSGSGGLQDPFSGLSPSGTPTTP
jgi:tetratricopeptide (TPR) repeat protein